MPTAAALLQQLKCWTKITSRSALRTRAIQLKFERVNLHTNDERMQSTVRTRTERAEKNGSFMQPSHFHPAHCALRRQGHNFGFPALVICVTKIRFLDENRWFFTYARAQCTRWTGDCDTAEVHVHCSFVTHRWFADEKDDAVVQFCW